MHVVRTFLSHTKAKAQSAAVLFSDLTKAFYSVVVALATGPTAPCDRSAALLDGVEASLGEIERVMEQLRNGRCERAKLGFTRVSWSLRGAGTRRVGLCLEMWAVRPGLFQPAAEVSVSGSAAQEGCQSGGW